MTLNIGVIGTGAIGRDHIRRCSKVLQGSRVVAVNDINRDNAAKVVSDLKLDAKVYDNGHDLV
ncbi:MAG: Gfo/Idh/MocA family oxidoreductase, partial [Serratia proteamaculans]